MVASGSTLEQRMRDDWNARARQDARYYVAFGRRDQNDEEFQATALEVVKGLEWELRRLGEGDPRARRFLEIGCGPGRLLRPMSRHCGEIHGIDVSDEMIRLARQRLLDIAHVHLHVTRGSDLAAFASDSFDLVYSYAVFQHIPSREVVFAYLHEAWRVLKPGGLLRCQVNGLPETARQYDTWSGVRIPAEALRQFLRQCGWWLFALEGAGTQYLWVTCRKPTREAPPAGPVRIRSVTNAHSSEPVAPSSGRFSSLSVWTEGLSEADDLFGLEVNVGGAPTTGFYLGWPQRDGLRQLNVQLQAGSPTGLQPVELRRGGVPACAAAQVRVIPPPPLVPRVTALSDGVDLLSGLRIVSGTIKVTLEEVRNPDEFRAELDGVPLRDWEHFCTDPLPPRFEFNLRIPDAAGSGPRVLNLWLGDRPVGTATVELAMRQR